MLEGPDYGRNALVSSRDEHEGSKKNDEAVFDYHSFGDTTWLLWRGDQLDKRGENERQGCAAHCSHQRYEQA